MELYGMALCLETASLQRWKCETLIDHFNWKSFVCKQNQAAGKCTNKDNLVLYAATNRLNVLLINT